MLEAKRTLVKSGPELWAEVTDPGALARHLGPFGSVRITRTAPDTLVEWEGERASGAVRLEPAGFGTRVILTARTPQEPDPPAEAEPEPPQPAAAAGGFLTRLFRRSRAPEPVSELEPPAAAASSGMSDEAVLGVLTDCLETLGSARHRPFSRV